MRGFRVEVAEVEAALMEHGSVAQAVVVGRQSGDGTSSLAAYIVRESSGAPVSSEDLRSLLNKRLPEYMVPSTWMFLDSLPLTPNGKVLRLALPPIQAAFASSSGEYVAPRNAAETKIAELYSSLLGAERVGIHENFFQLGGHSLIATQLASRIREESRVHLPVRAIFESPTVAGLAALVDELQRTEIQDDVPEIVRVDRGVTGEFLETDRNKPKRTHSAHPR